MPSAEEQHQAGHAQRGRRAARRPSPAASSAPATRISAPSLIDHGRSPSGCLWPEAEPPGHTVPGHGRTTDVAFAGAARQAEPIRDGEVSSRELIEMYLERIERLDPQLNAYRIVMAERALAEADQADARRGSEATDRCSASDRAQRHPTSPASRPRMARAHTTARGRGRRDRQTATGRGRRDRQDQPSGARLPDVHRVGHLGAHPQPVEPGSTTGGSSGGSGAAVAAGLAAAAMASDGAGSIRYPGRLLRRCSGSSHSAAASRSTPISSTGTGCPSTAF